MATGMIGGVAADGGDPRLSVSNVNMSTAIPPKERALHDIHVTFEEYVYYAERARAEEDAKMAEGAKTRIRDLLIPSKGSRSQIEGKEIDREKRRGSSVANVNLTDKEKRAIITDEEWTNANRALRSASAAACFYLITTDILGPFGIGFAIGTMGWIQGIILFTLFGVCAGL